MIHVRRLQWVLSMTLIWWHGQAYGQILNQTAPGLPDVRASAVAWGDVDNDGDLDLAIAGLDATGQAITKIFTNAGGVLTEDPQHQITGVIWGDLAWGDFDNDGRLDLAVSGQGQSGNDVVGVSKVYRNVDGVLTEDPAQLVGPPPFFEVKLLRYSSVAWADYTNDGRLDLLIAGIDRNGFVNTRLYTNQNNVLTENITQSVVAARNGAVDWGDFNKDGLPDLAVMGLNEQGLRTTAVYLNQNGLLIEAAGITLPAVYGGDVAWSDYDQDGNLDLAVSGWDEHWNAVLKVFQNNALRGTLEEAFTLQIAGRGLVGRLAWGDYDNDGWPDLAVAGRNEITTATVAVFKNNAGAGFTLAAEPALTGVMNGALAWGDADNDGRLDLLVAGEQADGTLLTTLYTNSGAANTAPGAPTLRPPVVTSKRVTFRWTEASDTETPNAALTYNLRVGTSSGGNELFSAAVGGADTNKGAGPGNVGRTLIKAVNFSIGVDTLYWSVQTVDGGFERSAFANEDTIVIERLVNSEQQLIGVRQNILGHGAAWGDYNNDGWTDLVVAGQDINGDAKTILYRNDAGTLAQDEASTFNGLVNGALVWGDYDRDGDLDLFRSGEDRFGNAFTFLYKNQNGVFEVDASQPHIANLNLTQGSAAWGDYNNDGRLDLAISGLNRSNVRRTYLYKNVPGDTLVQDTAQSLTGTANGHLAWGDIDNDGDIDLILSGESGAPGAFVPVLEVYFNNDGILTRDDAQNLTGFFSSAVALGDIDNDGDLDLVVTGGTLVGGSAVPAAIVYRNNGSGNFSQAQTLTGTFGGSVALGDVDNDGDMDLILTGQDATSNQIALLYRNDAGAFTQTTIAVLPGIVFSAAAWADYDRDRDLDLALTGGKGATFAEITQVFDNLTGAVTPNGTPTAPLSLTAEPQGDRVVLTWNDGTDAETLAPGLTYALRVGTTPGGHDIVSGARAVGVGDRGHAHTFTLKNLPDSTYYWAIRSIDAGLARSAESAERQFVIDTTAPSVASVAIDPAEVGIGTTVNIVVQFNERVGLDLAIPPAVSISPAPGVTAGIPVQQISYSGNSWAGSITIGDSIPTSTMFIGVSGATDLLGNVMTAVARADSFNVRLRGKVVVSQGGRIEGGTNDIRLYIPPNTFTEDQDIAISAIPETDPILSRPLGGAAANQTRVPNTAFVITPVDLTLQPNKPATLSIRYADSDVTVTDETTLKAVLAVFRFDETTQTWMRIGGSVDTNNKVVTTVITRLGRYALFEDPNAPTSPVALANFRAQPRVLSPRGNRFNTTEATISFDLGQSFPVTVEIYNIAGRLERVVCRNKRMGPGTMVEMWDGRDEDGNFVGSGLYLVIIDAGGHKSKLAISVLND